MSKERPQHAPMNQFAVVDNSLVANGVALLDLVRQAGQTPFYAYDSALMTQRVADLRAAMPQGISLHYAMKANPMPAVVKHMSGLTEGLDVASAGELRVALATGIDPRDISFAGPGKSAEDLALAVSAGVIINMESFGEMERIAAEGERTGQRPVVAVRVNPDFELKTSGMKMGGGPKPFGVDAEKVPEMLGRIGELDLDFVGFHIFSGSQNLKPEAIIEAQDNTFELALRLAEHAPCPLRWLNIGGGLGIPYFPGEQRLELEAISSNLEQLLGNARNSLNNCEFVMELGRYLVAEAGIYVCEVVDRKESRGETYLVTNGGLHHHLAASGNFGQVIRKNYPVCVGNRVSAETLETQSIVGPLCTPLDILGDRMELPRADVGDLIVVFQSGAYGYTASPHQFLSHPAPEQILV